MGQPCALGRAYRSRHTRPVRSRVGWLIWALGGWIVSCGSGHTTNPIEDAHGGSAAGGVTGASQGGRGGQSEVAGGSPATSLGGTTSVSEGGASGAVSETGGGAEAAAGSAGADTVLGGAAGEAGSSSSGGVASGGAAGGVASGGAASGGVAGASAGSPGVAGAGGADCVGRPFTFETVEENTVYNVSIAVDATGRPHLAYAANLTGLLHYAVRGTNGWQIETLATDGNLYGAQIVLDASGNPCAAYTTTAGNVRVVCRAGSEDWTERFSTTGQGRTALAFDAVAGLQLLWQSGAAIQYVALNAPSALQSLVNGGLSPRYAIAVASDAQVHALVTDTATLFHFSGTSQPLSVEELAHAGTVQEIAECDVVRDASGGVHVVYNDPSHAGRRLWYRGPADTSFMTTSEIDAVGDIQLAVDARLGPHIVYRANSAVSLAHRCQDQWTSELVAAANATPDLAFAPDGTLHIAYAEAVTTSVRRLRYAFR